MKLLLVIALAAFAAITVHAADVAGTWKGSMQTQAGETEVTLTFEAGSKPAGKAALGEYGGSIERAVLDGENLDFEVNIGPGTLTFSGTVSGDTLKLNVTGVQGNKYTLVCRRQK